MCLACFVFTPCYFLITFSHSVDALVEESGCSLENLATTKFRMCVLAGNWKQVNLGKGHIFLLTIFATFFPYLDKFAEIYCVVLFALGWPYDKL